MDNIYDILNRFTAVSQPLMEGRGSKPDFLDLDKDGDRKEPMKKAAAEVDEASYSAKKARAGKDIGKPGKNFEKIAKSAGERYGSKERGEKVAGAVLAKLRAKESVAEGDVEEGNDFTGARLAAIKAGKPTFRVNGKVYKVTGDTSDEKVMEREYGQRADFDKYGRPGDTIRTAKGTLTKTAGGVKHERRPEDEEDMDADYDDSAPKKKGRPKGSKRALGAKGPTGKSKLLQKGSIKEHDLEEDYDRDEYDEEGEMAKSQSRTIADAAKELQMMLGDDENLPEWVQKKIALAQEYIDSARDYLAANRPDADAMIPERELTKPEMKKREEIVKSMKKSKGDFEKRYGKRGEAVMYATATKQAKKAAESKHKNDDTVEETTVSGSVAVSMAEPAKGKKGSMIFGKGVYEGRLEESYKSRLEQMLTEGMTVNMSMDAEGGKNLTVTATDNDAVKLAAILKLAGMQQAKGYDHACPTCGAGRGMCEHEVVEEADLANSADDTVYADTNYMTQILAGGLNGPKLQSNPNNPADNPLAMRRLGQHGSSSLNLGSEADNLKEETERRLRDLYQRFQPK